MRFMVKIDINNLRPYHSLKIAALPKIIALKKFVLSVNLVITRKKIALIEYQGKFQSL